MGKVFKVTINIYSDSNYSNLLYSIPDGFIGIAVGNTTPVSLTNMGTNYNFFTGKLAAGEDIFLGYTNIQYSGYTFMNGKDPQKWLPLSTSRIVSQYPGGPSGGNNWYIEYVFANGAKIRGGFYGNYRYLYDATGVNLGGGLVYYDAGGYVNDPQRYPRQVVCDHRALVVSAMNPDGTIPDNASMAIYRFNGWWSTPAYGQIEAVQTAVAPRLRTFFNGIPGYVEDTDPYAEIPASEPSTPSGTYDFETSDAISFPTLPQLSAVSTGFISLWSPTEEQMLKLSSFMWNADPLTIDFWKKIVADPMKLIYGLNIIPLDLEEMGLVDGEGTVVVGLIDTGVLMNHLSTQWIELDCGSITLDETWSAYLDYDPYTKLEVYLPYCGTHPLKVDDFMPGTISLKYHIDLLTGACVAILVSTKSDKHGDVLNSVVYQFMGNCAAQLPVTSEQYADAVRSIIQLAASIGTMVALGSGGAGAVAAAVPTALPTAWGHFDSPLHTTSALSTQVAGLVPAEDMGPIDWRGYMPSAGTPSVAETASKAGGTLKKIGGIHAASAAVENVMGIKPNIERSGAIGSTGGLLSVQTPYIILTRPRQARPAHQNEYTGYPSFITETLGDLEGWTIVQAIHLENIACTAEELAEIDELLKSGVIF